MPITLTPPIFVALDVDEKSQALDLAFKLKDQVGGFKIGPRLTYKYGETLTSELARLGPVFVDNKYYDIPSTMLAAIRASFSAGATFVTIHASAGTEALRQIAALESELNRERAFQILCVTVLTSFTEGGLPANWRDSSVEEHVLKLATQAHEAGLRGLVASAAEVAMLRKKFPDVYLVTPGIRLPGDSKGDQARVMTPGQAIEAGSSALVVGRTIVAAKDPIAAARTIAQQLR